MTKELLGGLELNRIYQRDCLEGMRMLPDASINLIVIDPPYNIGKDKRWDKWRTVEDYVNFMTEVFIECERVLKPNGSFYWFHNDMEQIRKLMDAIDEETRFVYKQLITWNKIDPSFKNYGYVQQRLSIDMMRNYYNGFTEYCVYYTFQKLTGFDEINELVYGEIRDYLRTSLLKTGLRYKDIDEIWRDKGLLSTKSVMAQQFFGNNKQLKVPVKEKWDALVSVLDLDMTWDEMKSWESHLRSKYETMLYPFNVATVKDDLRANSNVWLYPPAKNLGHITPKPVELIENIIRHSSNEGDVVLDCFMGSGTTAVASVRTGRKFIGFEREPEYIELANKRLDNEEETD
jgi:DNA modification methylase